jgi:hypothetical protein
MTMTKFVLRTAGEHREIARGKYSFVPGKGDLVSINDRAHSVYEVILDLSTNSVTIYLNV